MAGQKAKVTNAFANERRATSIGSANQKNQPNNLGHEANAKNSTTSKDHEPMNLGKAANEQRKGNNNNVYGGRDGVYRSKDGGGWEQRGANNEWEDVKDQNRIQSLDREQQARDRGDTRAARSRNFRDGSDDRGGNDNNMDRNADKGRGGNDGGNNNRRGGGGMRGGNTGRGGHGGHRR